MGKTCCAVGCTNRFTKGTGVSFYRFPKDPARRGLWISAFGRKNWTPNAYSWICSVHFVSGEVQLLRSENCRLKNSTECLTEAGFQENNAKVKFYTGLPSFTTLMAVFACVSAHVISAPQASLTAFQQFVMVLMKLRLNLTNQDLAYHFGVHQASISRIFRKWINVMYRRLRPLIRWPAREELLSTMPVPFRKSFKRCVVIIDCFEEGFG